MSKKDRHLAPTTCPLHRLTKLWTQHSFVRSASDQHKHSQKRPQVCRAHPRAVPYNSRNSPVTILSEGQCCLTRLTSGLENRAVALPRAFFLRRLLHCGKSNSTVLSVYCRLVRFLKFDARKNSTQKPSNLSYSASSPGTYGSERTT